MDVVGIAFEYDFFGGKVAAHIGQRSKAGEIMKIRRVAMAEREVADCIVAARQDEADVIILRPGEIERC